jgi:crotonobetainyl-CoA:carnitine CoA-transferase CaiB-like acyl-CoA transferase
MLDVLRGVRVLDLTRMLAGPYGSMILGDLGADVIKVERPVTGDDIRQVGPHFVRGESVYFLSVNRNKRSLCLDLAHPDGRAVLADLALGCDVVIENFRAGVAERLGCDHATLSARNPRIITCGITAFGRTGPDHDLPAFDLTLQARGGVMGLTGEPGGAPVRCGVPIGDLAGGLYAAIAINAALYARERTGRGQFIDLGLVDCQVSLLSYAASNWMMAGDDMGPQGSGHAHAIPYQAFETADGWITVAVFTDTFWAGFCRALGRPAWERDARMATNALRRAHRDEVLGCIAERLREGASSAWLAALYAEGVPAGPVQRVSEVCRDAQVRARHMIAEMEHPVAGPVRAAGNPMKMGDWAHEAHRAAPLLGEHTDAVLREVAGYDDARVEALRARGVIA